MTIRILLTGGTIDKQYNESNGELDFVDTHIPKLLALGRNRSDIATEQLMLKDSLEMTDSDRQQILGACKTAVENKILITHGTDTMVQSAKVLAAAASPELSGKTIVLTGAMVPFVFKHSDAIFNLGFALGALQTLPAGIYIAMNGQVFDWDKVVKNLDLGIFERVG